MLVGFVWLIFGASERNSCMQVWGKTKDWWSKVLKLTPSFPYFKKKNMVSSFGGREGEWDWLKCIVGIGIALNKLWWLLELSGNNIYSHTKSRAYRHSLNGEHIFPR